MKHRVVCAFSCSTRSIQETPTRRLCHFVEHMAFNGSKNFSQNDVAFVYLKMRVLVSVRTLNA
ncbi:insulinase family protein [Vibrio chagasii]|nr:insulinase family protein [Vibrio chagasii]